MAAQRQVFLAKRELFSGGDLELLLDDVYTRVFISMK
jgi:hypothetical protein